LQVNEIIFLYWRIIFNFNIMPTIYEEKGFRFFFYSGDRYEPAHVHVEKGEKDGKIWLEPQIKIKYLNDFKQKEQKIIMGIVADNIELFKAKWYEFFQQ